MRRRCTRCGKRHAGTHGGWFTVTEPDELDPEGVGRMILALTRKRGPLLAKCQTFVDPGPWWRRRSR